MKEVRNIMGMPVTIEVPGARDDTDIEKAFEYLRWVDQVFSTYKLDSQISRLNRGELKLEDCDDDVLSVLDHCKVMKSKTNGYFDIRCDIKHDAEIDPSGYVKGWAIEGAANMLKKFGNYSVEAGGDMQLGGHNDKDEPWKVGIRNPFKHDEVVKVLHVTDGAVATSGNYERGEHIYDPHTGKPATALASVTVIGPNIVVADVYATAAFAMGAKGADWIAAQGLDCYVIDNAGKATFTPGLNRYI